MRKNDNHTQGSAGGLLSPEDLAEVLGVPTKTLARWRSQRTGPLFLRVGVYVRYRQTDVDAWLEGLARDAEKWMAS